MIKRLFDICLSVLCLLLFAPFFILIAILIKLDTKGPIIYRQIRVGKNGRPFTMYRFRSLKEDSRGSFIPDSLLYDSRLTHMGYFMRATSIDVIPQFWNVLKGDMSIVGPRPAKVHQVDREHCLWQRSLQVRPGIVSPSFLRYGINFVDLEDRLKADLECLERQSVGYEFLLIVRALKLRSKAPLRSSRTE